MLVSPFAYFRGAALPMAADLAGTRSSGRRVAVATAAAYRTTQALAKLTTVQDGRYRIISDPPLIVPLEEVAGHLDVDAVYWFLGRLFTGYARTLPAYRRRLAERFALTRVARKVVGVGSVGTEAWILLMEPDDGFEPLLLQAKQAQRSLWPTTPARANTTTRASVSSPAST